MAGGALDLQPEGSSGHAMDPATRSNMESHFGLGLGHVRLHTGAPAARAAASIEADAYTIGRDVYFGEGKYDPQSLEGQKLIAHELTHVVQQDAGRAPAESLPLASDSVVIGSPHDPLEKEAEASAAAYEEGGAKRPEPSHGAATADNSGEVRRKGWTWTDNPLANTVSAGAGYVASGVKAGVAKGKAWVVEKIEQFAPGAIQFFRGIRDYFKNAIEKGVEGLFGGIVASIREKGIAATLVELLGGFAGGAMRAVGGFLGGQCAAFGALTGYLIDTFKKLGGKIFDGIKKDFESAAAVLDGLWTEYGSPALTFVKKKLAGMWKWVEETASKFWDMLKPLRQAAGEVWDAVTEYLAEGRKTVSDWMDGFIVEAVKAWEALKTKIKPYMEKIKTVAKVIGVILLLFSPAGPFVVAGAALYGLYLLVKAVWEKWGQKFTRKVREWWVKEGLPPIVATIDAAKKAIETVRKTIGSAMTAVSEAIGAAVSFLGGLAIFKPVKEAISGFGRKVQSFVAGVEQKLGEWAGKVQAVAAAAAPYVKMMLEGLRQTLMVTMFGPMAILDDGVWNTTNRVVRFIMRTPCLKELGGLMGVPRLLSAADGFRTNMKAAWKLLQNPEPIWKAFHDAIEPMVAKIDPGIRQSIVALGFANAERQLMIQVSIISYVGKSLVELGSSWWPQLKKLGHDLLWPWDEVGKEFMPMLREFGHALSAIFDLEFSKSIDHFLEGMRKFNAVAGALSGWFMLASVLIGAALGALGFVTGPGGVATVGAGASAGLAFAESVGIALLAVALGTEAGVIAKAKFDLDFQNPRMADAEAMHQKDQEDCKKIAGSIISVVVIGAMMLLGDVAARFAKWLASFAERIPILRDIVKLLKNAKQKVSDFSLVDGKEPGARTGEGGHTPAGEMPREGDVDAAPAKDTPEGRDTPEQRADDAKGEPEARDGAEPVVDEANLKQAEELGIPPEAYKREMQVLREKSANPENIRQPKDKRFDAEMDAEGHTYDRRQEGNWCRFSDPKCGVKVEPQVEANVKKAKQQKQAGAGAPELPPPGKGPFTERRGLNAEQETRFNSKREALEADGNLDSAALEAGLDDIRYQEYLQRCSNEGRANQDVLPRDRWQQQKDQLAKSREFGMAEEASGRKALQEHVNRELKNNNEGNVQTKTVFDKELGRDVTTRPDSVPKDGKLDLVHDHKTKRGEDLVVYDDSQLRAQRKMLVDGGKQYITISGEAPLRPGELPPARPSEPLGSNRNVEVLYVSEGKVTHRWKPEKSAPTGGSWVPVR